MFQTFLRWPTQHVQVNAAMFEKLMWISTYMLVGAANDCATVGDAGKDHGETVERIPDLIVSEHGVGRSGGPADRTGAVNFIGA